MPTTVCSHLKLEALFLDENQLTGIIPSCLGTLTNLKQLFVFKNLLTGKVPVELSALRQLSKFSITAPFQL